MSESFKLTYFDGRGLAEISRLLFVVSGTQFEDSRIPLEQDRKSWLAVKDTFPFKKIPDLTYNGTHINHSKAIERFLARKFHMLGSNELETALVEGFSEYVRDIMIAYGSARGDDAKVAKFWAEDLNPILAGLAQNAGNNGHFVGEKTTLPDIQFYYLFSTFFDAKDKVEAALAPYDNLRKIRETVANIDSIKEHVSKRKETPF
eukprot:TRINITY_DN14903_c0_g1_i2.p1 TRINITY_DN14903_c0_g1~~TRINITY_DN14903_c0_g1_i2.p1  ORF type:complete len:204 (+),score=69.43 TRINITY_DN14903_c0_g1_i2:49-660(+)